VKRVGSRRCGASADGLRQQGSAFGAAVFLAGLKPCPDTKAGLDAVSFDSFFGVGRVPGVTPLVFLGGRWAEPRRFIRVPRVARIRAIAY
jgi:hypothetical protein